MPRPAAPLQRSSASPPRPKPPPLPNTRSHDDPSNAPALFAVCPVECPTSPPRRDTTAVLICPFESPDDGRSEPIVATPLSGPCTSPRLLCCSCCILPQLAPTSSSTTEVRRYPQQLPDLLGLRPRAARSDLSLLLCPKPSRPVLLVSPTSCRPALLAAPKPGKPALLTARDAPQQRPLPETQTPIA
ncbi:extensin-like [Eucalyptus grandis]|uniref:extensin-like n=1 Tax=Eucalyptus grandis TaxID=71139 RepID=UPI00192EBABB|nr:extensin-like [Eucalyptus grandis]